jgi:hypothetical protein
MTWTRGDWAVRPVTLTESARPVRMACLPGSDAEHLVVTRCGFVQATVSCPRIEGGLLDLTRLAAALPFPLSELRPS